MWPFLSVLLPILAFAPPLPDRGVALLDAIHNGSLGTIREAIRMGANLNSRDQFGATPLMHAGAFGSEECLRVLLAAGADVNATSTAGFTALMWSVSDPAKVRLLVNRHADPAIRTKDGHTALIIARQNSFRESATLLLAAGAIDEDGMDDGNRPLLKIPPDAILEMRGLGAEPMHLLLQTTPLFAISYLTSVPPGPAQELLDLGADPNGLGSIVSLKLPPLTVASSFGNAPLVRMLLEHGADPNSTGSHGLTPIMAAAASEYWDSSIVQELVRKGADINVRDEDGRTALDWAMLRGDSSAARSLRDLGGVEMARPDSPPAPVAQPRPTPEAVEKALRLIQPTSTEFVKRTGCISCHNNSLPAIAAIHARNHGVPVDAALAAHPARTAILMWSPLGEKLAVGASSVPGLIANVSFELTAMAEENFPRSLTTDAAAVGIARLQRANGSWNIADTRPPLGQSPVMWTALTVRGLQAYMPMGRKSEREIRIKRARVFLEENHSASTQDLAFALLGLRWSGGSGATIGDRRRRLGLLQREDGGWAQLPGMQSDAYATGVALYALRTGGSVLASDVSYQKGVQFLLRNQLADGSWFVRSRGVPFQKYIETGFPHGKNQFISSAATSWAIVALSDSLDR